jgi:hypothetical protein
VHADDLQASAERDQLWASLRALKPFIERLAQGQFGDSEQEQQLVQLLARIVVAELGFRASDAASPNDEKEGIG